MNYIFINFIEALVIRDIDFNKEDSNGIYMGFIRVDNFFVITAHCVKFYIIFVMQKRKMPKNLTQQRIFFEVAGL